MSHKCRQTIMATPWERAQIEAFQRETAILRFWKFRNKIRHPEAYAKAKEFNEKHGLSNYAYQDAGKDPKVKFLRLRKGCFKTAASKRPITLPKIDW